MQRFEGLSAQSRFRGVRQRGRNAPARLIMAFAIVTAGSLCAHPQGAQNPIPADPTEIVSRMVAQNEARARQLQYFTSRRHYHVEFHGLGRSMAADMHVQVTYSAGLGKSFQVMDESGSHLLLNHVLLKLLETEREDAREQKAALTASNYDFRFDSEANEGGRLLYVFSVEPKVKNKLLYRGKIWIDAADYAVVRVEAQPAENPSFWIRKTEIHHVYAKSGEFWLPQANRSESKTRFGGKAVLTIDYGTYQFQGPRDVSQAEASDLTTHALQSTAR
jgi:hypothetical protein